MANAVKIDIFGDELFRRRILASRHRARDMSPVLHKIGLKWVGWIEEQFATEGARGGEKWRRLERSTVLRRGSAHPILIDSANLLLDLTDPEHINVSDDTLTLDLPEHSDFIGGLHEHGFPHSRGAPVPARPPIVFTPLDRAEMRRDISDYLANGRL